MMKFGLIFWSMFTIIAIVFKVEYPPGAEQSTEIASRMFLIANIWAAGYILELRMKMVMKECVIKFADPKILAEEEEKRLRKQQEEERRRWYV